MGCRIPGYPRHRLARSPEGEPILLLQIDRSQSDEPLATFALEHLDIRHDVECSVSHANEPSEHAKFTVIRCNESDPELQQYFLQVLGGILIGLGSQPTQSTLARMVGKLVELFRLMAEPARTSVQGLWAELFLIAEAAEPATLLRCWHVMFTDVCDFNAGTQRVEVKSSTNRRRLHHFRLEQLTPPIGVTQLIASLFVERAPLGTSLSDLVAEIRAHVLTEAEMAVHLDEMLVAALGESWRNGLQARFDRQLAASSLALYSAQEIPKVNPLLPPGVSDVHFRASLDELTPVGGASLAAEGGLFSAL
ncbi:MAG: PD-(D/E)XK motif protein [Chloroflexota bacterium]